VISKPILRPLVFLKKRKRVLIALSKKKRYQNNKKIRKLSILFVISKSIPKSKVFLKKKEERKNIKNIFNEKRRENNKK
jgi:hypothetical protein